MLIRLNQEAANGPDRVLNELDRLLSRVEAGVHELTFEDIVAIEDSAWFLTLRGHSKELVRLVCEAQVWRGARARPRVVIERPEQIIPACDAAMVPLTILVENDASDGALVTAAVLAFGDAAMLRNWSAGESAVPRGWTVEFGGGAGEISRKVLEHGGRGWVTGPRLIVLCDSDRKSRAETADKEKKEITACRRASEEIGALEPVVLPLREAENYLPDSFWRAWLAEDRRRTRYGPLIDALLSLSQEQRDYIDMEGDGRLSEGPLGPLFDGSDPENPEIAPHHLRAFRGRPKDLKGSGHDETGASRIVIRRLPDMVRSGRVRAEDIEQRDRAGTLKKLVQLIRQEL